VRAGETFPPHHPHRMLKGWQEMKPKMPVKGIWLGYSVSSYYRFGNAVTYRFGKIFTKIGWLALADNLQQY
jgi:hypothetical protein